MVENIQMPRYKCHKEVWALHIYRLVDEGDTVVIHFTDQRYAPVRVTALWASSHKLTDNGYYVTYKDGYTSFSPQKEFEDGYTRIT